MYLNQSSQQHVEIGPAHNGHEKLPLKFYPFHTVIVVAAIFQAITIISLVLHLLYGNFKEKPHTKEKTYARNRQELWTNIKDVRFTIAADLFASSLCCLCIICAIMSRSNSNLQLIFNVVIPAPSVTLAVLNAIFCFTALALSKISAIVHYKQWAHYFRNHHNLTACMLCYLVSWWLAICAISVTLPIQLRSSAHDSKSKWWQDTKTLCIATETLLGIDIVFSVTLLACPLYNIFILKLQGPKHKKTLAGFLAIASCFCFVSSTARLVYLVLLQRWTPQSQDIDSFAYLVRNSYIWTMVDACLGIITPFWPALILQKAVSAGKDRLTSAGTRSSKNSSLKSHFSESRKHAFTLNYSSTHPDDVKEGHGKPEECEAAEPQEKLSSVSEPDTISTMV